MGTAILIIIVLIIVSIIALIIFISTKISNTTHRARQQVLGSVGLSNANISSSVDSATEKKHIQAFTSEHTEINPEQLKSLIKDVADARIRKDTSLDISDGAKKQMLNDKNLANMQSMTFVRVNITNYKNGMLCTKVVYSDNRDEYYILQYMTLSNSAFHVERFSTVKGMALGF